MYFIQLISRLLELCPNESELATVIEEAEELTPYAITTRYPGEDDDVSEFDCLHAIEIAKECRETIQKKFKHDGFNFTADLGISSPQINKT